MAQIIMPEPDSEPLCSRVYIVFGEEFKKVYYFTVEKGGALPKGGTAAVNKNQRAGQVEPGPLAFM